MYKNYFAAKPVTVGWGKKETQFHGSQGKPKTEQLAKKVSTPTTHWQWLFRSSCYSKKKKKVGKNMLAQLWRISGLIVLVQVWLNYIRGVSSFLLYISPLQEVGKFLYDCTCTLYLISRLLQLLQRVMIEGPGSAGGEMESTLSAVALTQPLVPASWGSGAETASSTPPVKIWTDWDSHCTGGRSLYLSLCILSLFIIPVLCHPFTNTYTYAYYVW